MTLGELSEIIDPSRIVVWRHDLPLSAEELHDPKTERLLNLGATMLKDAIPEAIRKADLLNKDVTSINLDPHPEYGFTIYSAHAYEDSPDINDERLQDLRTVFSEWIPRILKEADDEVYNATGKRNNHPALHAVPPEAGQKLWVPPCITTQT